MLDIRFVVLEQRYNILKRNGVIAVVALKELHCPEADEASTGADRESENHRRRFGFFPRVRVCGSRGEFAERPSFLELNVGCAEFERVAFGETSVHQRPTIEDVFALLEIGIFIARQSVDYRWDVLPRLAMTKSPEVAPGATAQVVARAVFEKFSVVRPTSRFPSMDDVTRSDEFFLFVRSARLKIPTMFGADFTADQLIEGDQKSDHNFVVAGLFGVFEQVLDDWLMSRAIEWERNISQKLFVGPGTRVFLPAVSKGRKRFWLIHVADGFDEGRIFAREVFFSQQHLSAFVLGSRHS